MYVQVRRCTLCHYFIICVFLLSFGVFSALWVCMCLFVFVCVFVCVCVIVYVPYCVPFNVLFIACDIVFVGIFTLF